VRFCGEERGFRVSSGAVEVNVATIDEQKLCGDMGGLAERRKRAMAAISSACVIRLPSGIFETICCSFSSGFGRLLSHSL